MPDLATEEESRKRLQAVSVNKTELQLLREYRDHHEFAVEQLCDLLGTPELKTIGDVVKLVKKLRDEIDELSKNAVYERTELEAKADK